MTIHSSMTAEIRVDIVCDIICPWCVISQKQLESALFQMDARADIYWHSFEVNPEMPAEGQRLVDYLTQRYGTTADAIAEDQKQLKELGAAVGFEFNFSDDLRIYNTFKAHQLMHWAGGIGGQGALFKSLTEAYFTCGENIGDTEVLLSVVGRAGLQVEEAARVLQSRCHEKDVRENEKLWRMQDISALPLTVFQRKHALTGAQGEANYMRVINWIHAGEPAPPRAAE